MRTLCGVGIALMIAGGALAQNRSGFVSPPGVRTFMGSSVFPGGTSATGVLRTTGSSVFPGGLNPQIAIPSFSITDPNFASRLAAITQGRQLPIQRYQSPRRHGNTTVFAYPVYVGGGYYDPYLQPAPPQQQQPNITVIYPPQQPTPVIVYPGAGETAQPSTAVYEPAPREPVTEPARISEPSHYLIAFKDRSIYAAVAYWVDGETLHYFTAGNAHNQASVTLIDRELTEKLNRDTGLEVKLPPAR